MPSAPQVAKTSQHRPTAPPEPPKAYKNIAFLNSPHARLLRVQCEFEEPRVRLEAHGIDNIVMIFGSARSKAPEEYKKAVADLRERVKIDSSVQPQLTRLERMSFLCKYHLETVKLAGLITKFSTTRQKEGKPTYMVGTGAGPGMMEAANEGAWRSGGASVGFGISLPFETGLNPFVTPELGFEFHYFFTRKFWMAYKCMGLVVAPGGYGTCDELFEFLTLMQTNKIKRRLPVILFGQEYWNQVLQFDVMDEFALIQGARDMVFICDEAEEAFEHLKTFWLSEEAKRFRVSRDVCASEPAAKRARLDGAIPERPMPDKAYRNIDYIKSIHSRIFRIQCEFEETSRRLEDQGITNHLMFIGSGSVKTHEEHLEALAGAVTGTAADAAMLSKLEKQQPLLKYHLVSRDLARRITAWSMARHVQGRPSFHVATGGGPGLVQAANEGAWEAGGRSIAFSNGVGSHVNFNRYVTPELAFVFNYFFTRKFWMAYKCMGVVALPGGFGTCDELFEILTLMQTGKIKRKIPVVLIGVDFWKRAIQWRKMADFGMISDSDVDHLFFTDSAEEAFAHIVGHWERAENGSVLVNK